MSDNQPYSEQWRLAAEDWVQKDAAARLLEDSKSAVLAQRMTEIDGSVAHAERSVKSSRQWADYVEKTVVARTDANLAKVKAEFLKMRSMEWQAKEATMRAEMRL